MMNETAIYKMVLARRRWKDPIVRRVWGSKRYDRYIDENIERIERRNRADRSGAYKWSIFLAWK